MMRDFEGKYFSSLEKPAKKILASTCVFYLFRDYQANENVGNLGGVITFPLKHRARIKIHTLLKLSSHNRKIN